MKYRLGELEVKLVGEGQYIAPNAAVIGDVTMHENSSVWFSCVLRGDADRIEIGAGSNIQDGTVMHADPGYPMIVGENVTVGHNAMLHGMKIPDGSLVLGSPAKIRSQLSQEQQLALMHNADHYVGNALRFSRELAEQE